MILPTMRQLVPLHTHSSLSILDACSDVDDYIEWCLANGAPGLALTDHGWMIGALEVYHKSKKAGLVGIPGVEFYLAPDSNYQFAGKAYEYYHVTAWAVTEEGYRNLLKLGSLSFDKGDILTTKPVKSDGKFMNVSGFHKRVITRFGQSKPRITFDELLDNNKGLVLGSGCLLGAANKAFLSGEKTGATRNLSRLLEVYKDRLFNEIMPHQCSHDWSRTDKKFVPNECTDFAPDGDLQKACNLSTIELSKKLNIPLLMTVDSHFVKKEDKAIQDLILKNGEEDGWHFYESYFMQTTPQAWEHWKESYGNDVEQRKIFAEAVENNYQIVEMAKNLVITDDYQQPQISIPEEIRVNSETEADAFKTMIIQKIDFHGRMKWDNQEWVDRLERELGVICDNGSVNFSRYFLFLEQWLDWAREHSILIGSGRGSGSGALLCYLLKITHLDPFEHKLPFERFLSQARISRQKYPDLDIDFSDREPFLEKLKEVYGDKFAQGSTHGTLKVKSSIKDAMRALHFSPMEDKIERATGSQKDSLTLELSQMRLEIEEVTRTIPVTPQGVSDIKFLLGYKDDEGTNHEGHLWSNEKLQEYFLKYKNEDPSKDLKNMVEKLLGIPRSVGRHASCFFISDRPIWESVPTCTVSNETCTQYTTNAENNYAEKAGLIKFDFLRVNTLQDISRCIRLVQKSLGYKVWSEKTTINGQEFELFKGDLSVEQIPMPDGTIHDVYNLPEIPEVFQDLTDGSTSSVFQLSSPLLTGFCKRIKPTTINDLSVLVAICRPGPLDAEIDQEHKGKKLTMTEAYIRRRDKEVAVELPHESLKSILSDTYGVAVFQEQLQSIFSDIMGYTAEEADYMREVIAKKKKSEMEKMIPEIRLKLKDLDWTDNQAQVLINLCIASAQYSFNRAHSAAYGMTAYMCTFLKHFYPKEWWTSVLQNCKVEDIKEKGYATALNDILVLPHINGPTKDFEPRDDGKVHAPLRIVDGVGDTSCEAIERATANGPFTSVQDFFDRIDKRKVNEGVVKNLVLLGAFEFIAPGRSPYSIMEEYLMLKKVFSLVSGKNKTGKELKDAVDAYRLKNGVPEPIQNQLQEFALDDMQLQILRVKLLPIYRQDVHDMFRKSLSKYIMYDERGDTFRSKAGAISSARTTSHLEDIFNKDPNNNRLPVVWTGFMESKEEFRYIDKKSGTQVAALKMRIANHGQSVECILWPRTRELMKEHKLREPGGDKIVLCMGTLRQGRVPGSWSVSVDSFKEI